MMRISVPGTNDAGRRASCPRTQAGFTLLELLIVLVVAGLAMSVAALAMPRSEARALREDARRLSFAAQDAHQRALASNRVILLELGATGYRVLTRGEQGLEAVDSTDALTAGRFISEGLSIAIDDQAASAMPQLISFGREPIGEPWSVRLVLPGDSVTLQANGLGDVVVD